METNRMEETCVVTKIYHSLHSWLDQITPRPFSRTLTRELRNTPRTSELRLQRSLTDAPISIPDFIRSQKEHDPEETVLYLGYGSNLCAETFLGRRGIRPLSQINVTVPSLQLTFDLPGVAYSEPCFANTRYRELPHPPDKEASNTSLNSSAYHKDRWTKGLVGVVYECTASDFAHIIATEGGGSGYQDVIVDCYALSSNPLEAVPATPSGTPFKAHTLFAPSNVVRPDHSYAQPSARYLKLITDGAAEHDLPTEYRDFLHNIRPFHITKNKQQLGLFIFLSLWAPIFIFFFQGGAAIFLKEDGTYPAWCATFLRSVFTACWASYDGFFRPLFGDGERTIGDGHHKAAEEGLDEKMPLLVERDDGHGTFQGV